jgi:CubicO group peptidase (beta-lactamase class C family)
MSIRLAPFIVLIVSILTAFNCAAQKEITLSPERVASIEALLKTEMDHNKIPGVSLAISLGQETVYRKGFGAADLENSVPAKAETVYRLGSLSKTITAVGVNQLAESHKIDLDAPIQKYCLAFPVKQWPVTARQLLAHLGGVRDYDNKKFFAEYFSTRHYNSVTESLDIFKNDPLVQEPGTKYAYSTYGYNLLGCAVEGASGTTYEAYILTNIFKPVGMNETKVDDLSSLVANRARGYGLTKEGAWQNAGLVDTSNKIPAGGLISTVSDMVKFGNAFQAGKLVSKASFEQMTTPQKTTDSKQIPYGLGWRIAERNGLKEIFHGGSSSGFSTFLYLLPEKKLTVVLMANLELLGQKSRDDLARQIADTVLK